MNKTIWIIIIFLLYLIIELVLHIWINKIRDKFAGRVNWYRGRLITNIITGKDKLPSIDRKGLAKFIKFGYDPELGWIRKANTSKIEKHDTEKGKVISTKYHINSLGSRVNHDNLQTKIACFGDSITFCRHVNDNQTWEYHLSKLIRYNITNFAVGNYGIDQAFLRCKRELKKGLKGSIVIMGVPPEAIRRSLSFWKHYSEFGNTFGFKPRFKLKNGRLKLIPNIIDNGGKFLEIRKYLKQIQKNDYFYKEKFKKYVFTFPYIISILKNPKRKMCLLLFYGAKYLSEESGINFMRSKFFRKNKTMKGIKELGGLYFDFQDKLRYYKEDKEMLELTVAIIKEFAETVKKYKKTPILVILPAHKDVEYMKKTGYIYHQPLIDETRKFIKVIDTSEDLLKIKNVKSIFADRGYGAHYNSKGNKIVAKSIFNFIKKEGVKV